MNEDWSTSLNWNSTTQLPFGFGVLGLVTLPLQLGSNKGVAIAVYVNDEIQEPGGQGSKIDYEIEPEFVMFFKDKASVQRLIDNQLARALKIFDSLEQGVYDE